MKIQEMTVTEIKDGIKNGSFTAYDVITSLFTRIKEIDPKVQSYLKLCEEDAIKQAKAIDEKIAKGESVGALAGVPIAFIY